MAAILQKIKGTADVFDGIVIAGPSIRVKPNFEKLAQYNIAPSNFQYQLQTALEGNVAGNILTPTNLHLFVYFIKIPIIFL